MSCEADRRSCVRENLSDTGLETLCEINDDSTTGNIARILNKSSLCFTATSKLPNSEQKKRPCLRQNMKISSFSVFLFFSLSASCANIQQMSVVI
jgi:hypothetical protein